MGFGTLGTGFGRLGGGRKMNMGVGGGGGPSLIASTGAGAESTFTTSAIDTTGADFLVVGTAWYSGGTEPTISDSKGNTWSAVPLMDAGTPKILYSVASSVGPGHTVTVTGTAFYCGATFAAFDCSPEAVPFDVQRADAGTSTIASTLAITPSENNTLIIANVGLLGDSAATSITGGFIQLPLVPYTAGVNLAQRMAYLFQTTAAGVDPDWTLSTSINWFMKVVSFKSTT